MSGFEPSLPSFCAFSSLCFPSFSLGAWGGLIIFYGTILLFFTPYPKYTCLGFPSYQACGVPSFLAASLSPEIPRKIQVTLRCTRYHLEYSRVTVSFWIQAGTLQSEGRTSSLVPLPSVPLIPQRYCQAGGQLSSIYSPSPTISSFGAACVKLCSLPPLSLEGPSRDKTVSSSSLTRSSCRKCNKYFVIISMLKYSLNVRTEWYEGFFTIKNLPYPPRKTSSESLPEKSFPLV